MNKSVLAGIAVAVVAAGGYFVVARRGGEPSRPVDAAASEKATASRKAKDNPVEAVRAAMSGMKSNPGARKGRQRPARPMPDMFANLSGEERKVAEAVQSALDADNTDDIIKASAAALESPNAEVRRMAVDALTWVGLDALPELTGAMADADEEVAEAAEYAWEQSLSEVDDADRRFAISAAVLGTLANDDHLETICGHLTNAALELVDGEDDEAKASELRVKVVQALVDIIESGKSVNSRHAKSAYEDITGNEWRGIDEAERYLQNPDDYELPEDRDDMGADVDVEVGDDADADAEDGTDAGEGPEDGADGKQEPDGAADFPAEPSGEEAPPQL